MPKLVLSNYRCFEDTHPAEIEFSRGFTAFVGPNNSGKSTALRVSYELRDLFKQMANADHYKQVVIASNNTIRVEYLGLRDPEEIRCNSNERPLSVGVVHSLPNENVTLRTLLKRVPGDSRNWNVILMDDRTDTKVVELRGGAALLSDSQTVEFPILANEFQPLADAMYLGPYRHPLTEGGGTHYDMEIGTAFIHQWDDWKTGNSLSHNRIVQAVTDDIARIFGFTGFDIAAAQGRTALQATIDGNPYRLKELGAGLAQFIVTLCTVAIRRPALLLIDEPEIHLHPSLQVEFLTALASHTTYGVAFATHSVGLARTIGDQIYSFRQEGEGSVVRPLDDTPSLAEFLGEMSFSAYRELGYKALLLVEGVSDVRVVMQFLRLLNADRGVVVFPLGGDALARGGVDVELAELTRLADHVYALADSERASKRAKPIKVRRDFAALCRGLGIKIHLTERRSLDNYLTTKAVKTALGSQYDSLGPFEKLGDKQPRWRKRDNWRAARLMECADLEGADVGKFLLKMKRELS